MSTHNFCLTSMLICTTACLFLVNCGNDENDDPEIIEIGALHQGGIIFYLNAGGTGGLICALNDQSASAVWCDDVSEINGADGTAIGTGNQNTLDILAGCQPSQETAAGLCANLISNGQDDWYLPSLDELATLHTNLVVVNTRLTSQGGTAIAADIYWTSTELNVGSNSSAMTYDMDIGTQGTLTKFGTARVRAIRSF